MEVWKLASVLKVNVWLEYEGVAKSKHFFEAQKNHSFEWL